MGLLIACLLLTGAAPMANAQSEQETQRAVEEALRRDGELRQIDVSIRGVEVTLVGPVPTFWAKSEAIRRALDVNGIELVATELEIPTVEDDMDIAEDVAEAIQRYPHYTIWDHVEGRIDQGVVTLTGRVTGTRDEAGEIFERVAKVRGVQDVQSDIQNLTPSTGDERLRRAIANQLFRTSHFERFSTMTNPPFHIIVQNSVVTLVGYVQSQIEYREMQRIVAQTTGVLRVDNQLQTIR